MAAAESLPKETSTVALPGLGRALVIAGKLGQKAAEDIFSKAKSGRTSFIAELTGSGAVSPSDLAHTMSSAFAAPLLDLDAIDPQRLPKGFATRPYRSSDSTVHVCLEGEGRATIASPAGEHSFDFAPRDVFVVPSWHAFTLSARAETQLFSFSDRPVQQALGLWRDERMS